VSAKLARAFQFGIVAAGDNDPGASQSGKLQGE
jgi:hypothetical protein